MDEFSLTAVGIACNMAVKITCFFLGYKTIKLGYQLMVDGIKGEFNFSADYKGLKGGLVSSSPGLLFLLLGILLIAYAMGVEKAVSMESGTSIKEVKVGDGRGLPHTDTGYVKDSL